MKTKQRHGRPAEDLDQFTVTIPQQAGVSDTERAVPVWPLVEAALNRLGTNDTILDAARAAIRTSHGCCVLANYLNSEAKRYFKMDYRFKAPLLVLAAELAREDGGADSYYCPMEGCLYFETDRGQFSFHVHKDWTVDWDQVADEVVEGYKWNGINNQLWALEMLLDYLEEPQGEDLSTPA